MQLRLLLQPEHEHLADRHFAGAAAALKYYGEWYGAYPYPALTIVDPVFQSDSGGMEYPTIFTAGARWLSPRHSNDPEYVVLHEAGHQFWYGLVANNEVEFAWLDEGINEYTDSRVQDIALQPNLPGAAVLRRLHPVAVPRHSAAARDRHQLHEHLPAQPRSRFALGADREPVARHAPEHVVPQGGADAAHAGAHATPGK